MFIWEKQRCNSSGSLLLFHQAECGWTISVTPTDAAKTLLAVKYAYLCYTVLTCIEHDVALMEETSQAPALILTILILLTV